MSISKLNEQNVVFLTNALGEVNRNQTIKKEVYAWYEKNQVDNEWLNYLVELNGEIGILSLQEYIHAESDEWEHNKEYYSDALQQANPEEFWAHLETAAKKINAVIDFDVFLGKSTGFCDAHELSIWFPLGTEKEVLLQAFKNIDDLNATAHFYQPVTQ